MTWANSEESLTYYLNVFLTVAGTRTQTNTKEGEKNEKTRQEKQQQWKVTLELNQKMYELEEKKMMYREKMQIQREMVEVLKQINTNIEKLIPPICPIDLDLLHTEQ